MAAEHPLANISDVQLQQYGTHLGIKRVTVMRRDTLANKIDDYFQTDEALSSDLQQFLSPDEPQVPQPNQQQPNDNLLNIEPLDPMEDEVDEVDEQVGIHLHLWATAHVIDDPTQIIEKKTMGNWTNDEFVQFVMETVRDDNEQETDLLLCDKIREMPPPSTATQEFPIEKISFHGDRHDPSTKFKRTGVQKADREWYGNKIQSMENKAVSIAKQNGSHTVILGSDTETKIRTENNGGRVNCKACIMRGGGKKMKFDDPDLEPKFNVLWTTWLDIQTLLEQKVKPEIMEKIEVEEKKEHKKTQKKTLNIAHESQKLLQEMDEGSIDFNEYKEKMKELHQRLLITAGAQPQSNSNNRNNSNSNNRNTNNV